MRYLLIFWFLFFCQATLPVASRADDLKTLETTHRRLRAEYDLATKPQIYFLFDLQAKKVQFKASGLSVAELAVHSAHLWGQIPTDKVRTVVSKHSFFTPEREVLKIPSPDEDTKSEEKTKPDAKKFELAALELSDMPTSYQLRFDDGLLISVRAGDDGYFPALWRGFGKVFWFLSRPLLTVWNYLQKQSYTELALTMPSKDAQLLYWSLTEGASCLVVD